MASIFHYTFLLSLLLIFLHHHPASAAYTNSSSVEEYTLDDVYSPLSAFNTPRNRTTRPLKKIKKGAQCTKAHENRFNICHGVKANNGTALLRCCKKHCRNVKSDKNNCGECSKKCRFGKRCCGGMCVDFMWNAKNCGKCGRKCPRGVKCEFGVCGYA